MDVKAIFLCFNSKFHTSKKNHPLYLIS